MKEKQIEIFITLGGTCKLESTLFDVEIPFAQNLTQDQQVFELLEAFCYGLENFPRGQNKYIWN